MNPSSSGAASAAFRLLSRGIHFKRRDKPVPVQKEQQSPAVPSPLPSPPDSAQVSSEDDAFSGTEDAKPQVTILAEKADGWGKNQKKKDMKRRSREKLLLCHQEKVNHFRNVHRIHVSGSDVPEPVDSWAKLKDTFGLPDNLVRAVQSRYATPTPIQMQAIPCLMEGRELLACAPTGSGKTAAFLIPLIHLLRGHRRGGIRAIILAPTRELAQQIQREALLIGECRGVRALVLDPSLNKASKNFDDTAASNWDIVISTPNRLVYLINEGKVSLPKVEWLIVDESDKLFESGVSGFRDQLAVVYKACDQAQQQVRRAMFSATLAVDVEQWCKLNLDNVLSVTIGERNTANVHVEQKLVYTGTEKGKVLALQQLVAEGIKPPVLIFVQSKDRAQDLYKEMKDASRFGGSDLHIDLIHSDRSELQRDAAVKAFRAGRVWVLICTELLGRGIDFKGVNLVVNYDFPPSVVSYIHRIGRTGRANRTGKAVTFFTDQDKILLRSVAQVVKSSGGEVPEYMLKMKKATRQEKRKLAKKAIQREAIIPETQYDKEKRVKKEQIIEKSKMRKRKREERLKLSESKKMRGESESNEQEDK